MLKNYVLAFIRNMMNNKLFVFINISGLSIGILACLLVYNYVGFHRSFDKMYTDSENIYRVNTSSYVEGQISGEYGVTMQFLAPELFQFTGVEDVSRLFAFELLLPQKGDQKYHGMDVYGADSTVFDFFGLDMLIGDSKSALGQPFSTVLTERAAKKIFNRTDVIGETLMFGYGFHEPVPYQITGIVADAEINTHINFDILLSSIEPESIIGSFTVFNGGDHTYHYPAFSTYMKIRDGVNVEELQSQIQSFLNDRIQTQMQKYGERKIYLQSLADIHLGKKYKWGMDTISSTRADEASEFNVSWISLFAFLLLLFSIFNFINLSLINYSKRWKESAMRTILGATRIQFLQQFFIEAFTLTFVSTILAVLLALLVGPYFYDYVDLPREYSVFNEPKTFVYIGILFFSILLFKAVLLYSVSTFLKFFSLRQKSKEVPFSRYLVVGQYMGAFILLNLTFFIHQQLDFLLSKDLGYNQKQVLVVKKYTMGSGNNSLTLENLESFKDELRRNGAVKSVSLSSIIPGSYHHSNQRAWMSTDAKLNPNTIWIDKDYLEVYGIELLAGTNISEVNPNSILINKELMEELGFTNPEDIIGESLYIDDVMSHHMEPGAKTISGVVGDYYQEPLSKAISATKYHYEDANRGYYSIQVFTDDYPSVLAHVEGVFNKFYPEDNFEFFFLDDHIESQYHSDIQFKELINITSLLSLIIATLGIFGLISHSVEIHRKSTAIRMVLGSNVGNIFMVFLRKYLIYYGIAVVLSLPVAYLLVQKVLSNYAYRINLNLFWLIVPAFPILALILVIVGSQVIKAAFKNPIGALRS